MVFRKGKRGIGKKNRAIPLAPIVPVVGVVYKAYQGAGKQFGYPMLNQVSNDLTGYNIEQKKWTWAAVAPFAIAEVAGLGVHVVASHKFKGKSLNMYLRRATFGLFEL